MNKHLAFEGGRAFKFAYSPPSGDIITVQSSRINIPLTTERYRFVPVSRSQNRFDAHEPVLKTAGRDGIPVCFPLPLTFDGVVGTTRPGDSDILSFTIDDTELRPVPGDSPRERFLRSGLWLEIRNLLTGRVIDPRRSPRRVFVATFLTEPFTAAPEISPGDLDLGAGISALRTILGDSLDITILAPDIPGTLGARTLDATKGVDTLFLPPRYPAHDGSIPLARRIYPTEIRKDPDKYWWLDLQTLARLMALVEPSAVDPNIVVALGRSSGDLVPGHRALLPFTPLSALIGEDLPAEHRVVTGGLLTGREVVSPNVESVRPWDRGVFVLANPRDREMLHYLRPGLSKDSVSPTFLSFYFPTRSREINGGIRGERRFCVSCNYCEEICPVGLDPQHLFKLSSAAILDEAVAHGLPRCSGCGLCSYVCPSKLELTHAITAAKAQWLKQLPGGPR